MDAERTDRQTERPLAIAPSNIIRRELMTRFLMFSSIADTMFCFYRCLRAIVQDARQSVT